MTLKNISDKETLPVGDEDRIIPTKLARLEAHIKFLKEQQAAITQQISDANSEFNALVARAKECHITTDSEYKIVEVPEYPNKRVDITALRNYPEKYNQILANIRSRLSDELKAKEAKAETFVSQADVKAVIRDKDVLAIVIPEQTVPSGYKISIVKR